MLLKYEDRRSNALEVEIKSLKTMYEINKISDDLTKYARLYVITGDPQFKEIYNLILAVKAGTEKRSIDPLLTKWEARIQGKDNNSLTQPESLNDSILSLNLTKEELILLKEAEDDIDALQALQIQAMNASEGKFQDDDENYTITKAPNQKLALEILTNQNFLNIQEKALEPLKKCSLMILERTHIETSNLNKDAKGVLAVSVIISVAAAVFMFLSVSKALTTISYTNKENEMLLLSILPSPIASRLKQGEDMIADEYSQASVLFADIVGYTEKTAKWGPTQMIQILNELFGTFDALCEKYQVEKIKTIGDCYMAVCGVPTPRSDHAIIIADFALAIKNATKEFSEKKKIPLQIRVGMHFGKVIAGVVGHKKFIYDLWGDVVNMASRMESSGKPDEIQVTDKMAAALDEQFILESREPIEIKGKGLSHTYFLKGRKSEYSGPLT